MKDKIFRAFEKIRADDALVERTAVFLREERVRQGNRRGTPRSLWWTAAVAAVAVLAVGIFAYNLYFTAVSYVSIDVNPSVELTLNRMDRVIGTYAFNAEGEKILREADLSGKRYDEAAALLVSTIGRGGYFGDNALVSVTVQTADGGKEQILCDALLQSVKKQVGEIRGTAEVEVFSVSAEVRGNAQGCHMSPARYLAIQELLLVDEEATLEQYSDVGIHQIRQRTQQCRSVHGTGDDAGDPSGGSGSSQSGHHGQRRCGGHGYRGGQ